MGKLNRVLPVAGLLGLSALIFFLRLHTYSEPLERDLTTYAVIAHEMLDGKQLYSDLWDHKPPAVHVTYAAAELVTGYGRDSIFLLTVVASVATLVACYVAGSAAGGGRLGGLVAASLWAIASGDLAIQGNQPNTEVFLNFFLTAGFAAFVRKEKSGLGWCGAALAGIFFAVASLYKQVVAVQAALIAFTCLASAPAGTRKRAFAEVALIAAIGAVAWLAVFGYFAVQGRGPAFTEAVFTYNRWYSGSIWRNLSHAARWPGMSIHALAPLILMGILSVLGIVAALIVGPRRPWILLLAFVVATHVSVLLPGRFYAHYYQLWLPPLAIGAAWAVALLQRVSSASLTVLPYSVAGATCVVLAALELPYYSISPEGWSLQKYGHLFLDTDRLAYQIDNLLSPGETFYEWGNESGFYFTSGRRPPSGIVFAGPALAGPVANRLSQHLLGDLARRRPELIIVNERTLAEAGLKNPVVEWFKENYRPFSETKIFLLVARKGGRLDAQERGGAGQSAKSAPLAGNL